MQTEYIIAATVKQHREDVCQETRLWFIKIKWGGGQNDTQGMVVVFFNSIRPSVQGTQVSARAPSLPSCSVIVSQWRPGRRSPTGVSHVRNIKGQFNLARPRLQSILISTAVTEELIFDLSEVGPGPVNHCNSH